MIELVNVYRQELPAVRFIGRRYSDDDRVAGGYAHLWEKWFADDLFSRITDACEAASGFDDATALLGLMRYKEGDDFQYWIGLFCQASSPVPEGFEHVDFPPSGIGIVWLQGPESELYMNEMKAAKKLEEEGHRIAKDKEGAYWFFERYVDERFMPKEAAVSPILDIGHFIA